jgi:hypothetical protein
VPRRIEIELTSAKDDGTWTWRAAGAKQPKGVLEGSVLYDGAKVGDVVRAAADFELDGITVVAVYAPKEKKADTDRLAVIGPDRKDPPPITSSLVAKRPGAGPRRDRDRPGGDRPPRDRDRAPRPRREGDGARPPRDRDSARPRREGDDARPRRDQPERSERPARRDRPARTDRGPRPERPTADAPAKPKAKRLNPGSTHRRAALEGLPAEQRAIAEELLRGGMPALRQSIATQNAKAKAEGTPEIGAQALLAMGEDLLPRLKMAEWMDRADAAVSQVDEISLRDLRSVVASAEPVARDDQTRMLASTLREALARRVKTEEDAWVAEIGSALDDSRVVRALRISARGPEPSSRFPAEVASRLAGAASEAMSAQTTADRWVAVLEAVSASPVRRSVKPTGLPADAPAPLLEAARNAAGQVPALAPLLGLPMPPPPGANRRPAKPPPPPPPPPPPVEDATAGTEDSAETLAH